MKTRCLVPTLICCLFFTGSYAQVFKRTHAQANEHPPKAILVELSTQTARINYLKKTNKTAKINELTTDKDSVISKMVADFRDHFDYCPYYFFYDTGTAAIKEKDFSSLLDANLQPAANIVLSPADTDYFVVYYGYEPNDENEYKTKHGKIQTANFSSASMITLLAMDYRFKLLPDPMPYKVKMGIVKHRDKVTKELKPYSYVSKHFDIQYTPLAKFFNATLTRFYGHAQTVIVKSYK